MLAGELGQLLDHDGSSRHVDADCERLGGEDHLDQAFDETRLDDFLHRRHHAGMVRGHTRFELQQELVVAEHRKVGRVEAAQTCRDDRADRITLGTAR